MILRPYAHVAILACIAFHASEAHAAPRIDWSALAYSDGAHNAFTDLIHWKGMYYLGFRHGVSHASLDGEIRIMTSPDMKTWTASATLDTFGDDRDLKFVAVGETLYAYFGVWDIVHRPGNTTPDRGAIRSYVARTTDGVTWSPIKGVYEPGFWLWRVRYHDGAFYSAAYTAVRPTPTARETRILRSSDGLSWEQVSLLTNERMAGEADLLWRPDGTCWVLTRTGDEAGDAEWFTSDSAMKTWTHKATGARIHAPVFVALKDRVFIAGRDYQRGGSTTKLWEIIDGRVVEVLTLPSGGDTSYPGLIVDPACDVNTAPALLMSWYSQHETDRQNSEQKNAANIYVARILLTN